MAALRSASVVGLEAAIARLQISELNPRLGAEINGLKQRVPLDEEACRTLQQPQMARSLKPDYSRAGMM